jgi:phosphoglucosamine mutase
LLQILQELEAPLVHPEHLGRVSRLEDVHGRYIEYVKRSFTKNMTLDGMRIVVDCSHGAAYKIAPLVMWELGAEVVTIGCEPNGLNINAGCGSVHPSLLCDKVIETRSDIGIALDGDGDRLLVCDEKGKVITGEQIIAVIALHLKKNKKLYNNLLVTTHVSNSSLDDYLNQFNITTVRTIVGDKNVVQEMKNRGSNLGGEPSGHVIVGDYGTTGDGIIAALQVLAELKECNVSASELLHPFDLYPHINKNIVIEGDVNPLENKIIQDEILKIKENNKDLKIIVRKSGTENIIRIMVEGKDENEVYNIGEEIKNLFINL